jgi:hypothetical protein
MTWTRKREVDRKKRPHAFLPSKQQQVKKNMMSARRWRAVVVEPWKWNAMHLCRRSASATHARWPVAKQDTMKWPRTLGLLWSGRSDRNHRRPVLFSLPISAPFLALMVLLALLLLLDPDLALASITAVAELRRDPIVPTVHGLLLTPPPTPAAAMAILTSEHRRNALILT